ncbi:autotransporter [Novosphingobium sp. AP12]|uniref:autotransporter n=1 Tax=Novosphingobium sp. AP12 TaxID=1144305 RepID=UPI001872E21E|nr:autotransporter [Novosphingobium sp. AP12]
MGTSGDLPGRRASRLLLGSALASVAAGLAAPEARAQDACGVPVAGTVTCSPAGNPYPAGIEYYSPAADPALDPGLDPDAPVFDLTVVLEPGVRVQTAGGLPGVALIGFNDGAVTLEAGQDTAIAVGGTGAIGVLGLTNYGDLTINTDSIVATGRASAGINANSNEGDITITAGTIAVTGNSGVGISTNSYRGNVTIDAGTVSADGYYSGGIDAYAGNGDILIMADSVSTTGGSYYTYGSTAIEAQAIYGSIAMDLGAVSTQADYSYGISAVSFADGGVVDITADTITTQGVGSLGVLMQGDTANLSVGTLTTVGDGAYGAVMFGTGEGGTSFTSTGSVSTSGQRAVGVFLKSYSGGDAVIDVNAVSTLGDESTGAYGYSEFGDVTITAASVTTQGEESIGVSALAPEGDVAVTVGDVTTVGDLSPAVLAVGYNAAVTVNGDVTTLGEASEGVVALGLYGNAGVANNGTISTSGTASTGIYAGAYYDVVVSGAGSVQTSGEGAAGIDAVSLYGGITVTAGTISTSGDYAQGVHAYAQGFAAGTDVTVNVGSVTTAGILSDGVGALSLLGNVDVTSTGALTTGGEGAFGAYAFSLLGDATITVNDVTTSGDDAVGVQAYGYNASVTVNGDLSTSGTDGAFGFGAGGVQATGSFGTAAVTINGSVTTAGDYATGVFASGYNGATVTNNGAIATGGASANGVTAEAAYGPAVVVNNGTIATTGDYSVGVSALSYYGASVTNSGAISTSGAFADGVTAEAVFAPSVVVNSGTIATAGDYSVGVSARSYYGAGITNSGAISTSGVFSTGVTVDSGYELGTVVNTGTISTTGESSAGILVNGYADVLVQGTGAVTTSGAYSAGIGASTIYGTASISMASVTTTGEVSTAINAYGSQGAVVNVGTVSTLGANSLGVLAGSYGDVSITAGSITTAGADSDAIRAATFGEGSAITINVASARTTGTGSNAINALGFGGDVAVTLTGAVSAAQDTAVAIQSAGDASVSIGSGGSVSGAIDSIQTDAVGTTTIANLGTINTGTGYAISVLGGPAAITNAGVLNGRVQLSAGDDRFTNSGLFRAGASSDFGAGADVFTNTGTLLVDAPGTAPLAVSFTGLEAFNNSGLVELRNGTVGDQLTLPGTFTGSGASTLGLDLRSDASGVMSADRLNVGTAAGTTRIQLAIDGTVYATPGVTLVQASAASSPTAFTLPSSEIGFVALDLVYQPASFAYQLVGTPGSAAYRAAKALEGAQNLWYRSADAVTAHLTSLRDGGLASGGFWLQMSGGVDKRDESRTVTNFGITRSFDLDYRQDYYGGQAGFDFGGTGALTFGLTGGYMSSTLRFDDATHFDYDAVNAGVYASFRAGGFFVNALGKYDHYWIDAVSNAVGYRESLEGDAIGAEAEAGFRFGSAKFFAEPVASLAYVSTTMDDLQALGQVLDYEHMDGLRGKAGLRIGGSSAIGAGNTITFYASGMAVKEFEGDSGVGFVSGPYRFDIGNRPIDTYAQGTLGFKVTTPSGITGFVEGTADVSKDYKGAGGRAGIKIPF